MTAGIKLPICEWSGLPRLWCPDTCPDHGNSFTMDASEIELLNTKTHTPANVVHIADLEQHTGRPLPEYRAQQRWAFTAPDHVRCDGHQRPPGAQLCHSCDDLLDRLLGDVPAMVEDLTIALRKAVRFGGGGALNAKPDEAPVPFNPAASRALTGIIMAVASADPVRGARWWLSHRHQQPTEAALLDHLSAAMRYAHWVIERPRDRVHVGPCPACGIALETERDHDVRCPTGDYAASWDAHLGQVLEASQDRLLTESELVVALGLERRVIRNLTRRATGHQITRPHLDGHAIHTATVTVYRLGDITQRATQKGHLAS